MAALTIVIVTLNRREEVLALLADLAALPLDDDDGVVVIDNGSVDGTAAAIAERFPAVDLIRNDRNLGAPAARNAGAARASGDVLVFLDDDARVADRSFAARVRRIFDDEPDVGVVAFRILDPSTGGPRSFEIPSRRKERAGEPFDTSYFIAAGCAVRSATWDAAGGMDASLVYGFEELDLGYRVIAAGGRMVYRPQVTVLHSMSRAGRPGWRSVYYFFRNKIWVSARYLPWRMVLSQVCVWSVYFLRESLRARRPDIFVAALVAGLAGIPRRSALRRRDRLSRAALARLRAVDGRLYV